MTHPHARLFPLGALAATVASPRDTYHAGELVETEVGVMFACRRCCLLLDAEGWARDCPGVSQVARLGRCTTYCLEACDGGCLR